MTPNITVVNKYHGKTGQYIGRGSPLGNPFKIKPHGLYERAESLEAYDTWLETQIAEKTPAIINELNRLGHMALIAPLNLECFCAPRPCHGDIIRRVLLTAINEASVS